MPSRHLDEESGPATVTTPYDTPAPPATAGEILTVVTRHEDSGSVWVQAADGRERWVPDNTAEALRCGVVCSLLPGRAHPARCWQDPVISLAAVRQLVPERDGAAGSGSHAEPPFDTPPTVRRSGAAAFQNRIFGTRCNAGARRAWLAILVVPGFECFSGREHLDGQWGGGVGPASSRARCSAAVGQDGGGGADAGGGLGGADGVR
jgi:hypothetical protein